MLTSLTSFDLAEKIRAYNAKTTHNKKIADKETWGLYWLSKEGLGSLSKLIETINVISQTTYTIRFNEQERLAYKNQLNYLKEVKESDSLHKIKQAIAISAPVIQTTIAVDGIKKAEEKNAGFLNKEENWIAFHLAVLRKGANWANFINVLSKNSGGLLEFTLNTLKKDSNWQQVEQAINLKYGSLTLLKQALRDDGDASKRDLTWQAFEEKILKEQGVIIAYKKALLEAYEESPFQKEISLKIKGELEHLNGLKNFWLSHKPFTLVSSEFIDVSFTRILEALSIVHSAKKELGKKNKNMPKEIVKPYSDHLKELEEYVIELRNTLLLAMYACLKVAYDIYPITHELNCDDRLFYVMRKLKELGVLKQSTKINLHWETLSENNFNKFHENIQRYGSAELVKNINEFPIYRETSTRILFKEAILPISQNSKVIVPEGLLSFIPKKLNRPKFLYLGQYQIIRFIQDSQYNWAKLKLGWPMISYVFPAIRFKELDIYEQAVKTQREKIHQEKPSLFSVFRWTLRYFLNQWETMLIFEEKKCVAQRIKLLQEIAAENADSDQAKRDELWKVLQDQFDKLEASPYLGEVVNSTELSALKNALAVKLQQDPVRFAVNLLSALSRGENQEEGAIEYLLNIFEINSHKYNQDILLDKVGPYKKAAVNTLWEYLFKVLLQEKVDFTDPYIGHYIKLTRFLGDKIDKTKLDNLMQACVIKQIKNLSLEENTGRYELIYITQFIQLYGNQSFLKLLESAINFQEFDTEWHDYRSKWRDHVNAYEPSLFPSEDKKDTEQEGSVRDKNESLSFNLKRNEKDVGEKSTQAPQFKLLNP